MAEVIKVSIIVPVYKVEEYLNQCIQSIIDQTYKDIEIILVDDGSPDKCGEICDEWAKKMGGLGLYINTIEEWLPREMLG